MNATRIRFGTHARLLRANGWRSIIWVKGKIPGAGWSSHGLVEPSDELFETWIREYPDCGIGLVTDGRFVAVDIDVCDERFRSFGFNIRDAERAAQDLVSKLKTLALTAFGSIDFARVGLPPKTMLLYAAADTVPTMAGGPVEVFSTRASKQVVIGGFHPIAVDEYKWIGRCSPVTHPFRALHPVSALQVTHYRAEALQLCARSGLKLQSPATGAVGDRAGNGHVSSGIVGDYMSEVLSLIGKAWRDDPREIAAEYFRQSTDGEKHYRMVAVCGALILRRFTDDEIIAALEPAYRAIVHDDPSMSRLRVCPQRMRSGMRARGTNITTLAQLDAWLGPKWSIRNA
jgi:hypothetical protein